MSENPQPPLHHAGSLFRVVAVAVMIIGVPGQASAQDPGEIERPVPLPSVSISGGDVDSWRDAQLRGSDSPHGFLLRSPSSLLATRAPATTGFDLRVVAPEIRTVFNSEIPHSLNQGSIWAGRGLSARVRGGGYAAFGRLRLLAVPEVTWSENRDFPILPSPREDLSRFASPFYTGPESADVPLRFGNQPFVTVHPGQSALYYDAGPAHVGLATENQWWGPGRWNAIVLSDNAPGFPHAFARTAAPLQTLVGDLEARWILGVLSDSPYYSRDPSHSPYRSLSGAAVALRPAGEPNLEVGLARAVYGTLEQSRDVPQHTFNFLRYGASEEASVDQLTSVFARWVFPSSGVETYGEWARLVLPASLGDFLEQPNHTQGYTLGLRWTDAVIGGPGLRLHAEITYLEQSPTYRLREEAPIYYASSAVAGGYTHQGRVLGAATGPGSSSQNLLVDFVRDGWSVGLEGGRIRWNNDIYHRQPTGVSFWAHDVSLLGGLRGSITMRGVEVRAAATYQHRHNFLFRSILFGFGEDDTFDAHNLTIRFDLLPRTDLR